VGNNGFGARYHMIYAPAAYVVTFARLYSYADSDFTQLQQQQQTATPKTFCKQQGSICEETLLLNCGQTDDFAEKCET
jgi:hypothetical protein